MALECEGSSSATIYFRAKGAADYEKFYTENCPVDVQSGGGPVKPCDLCWVEVRRQTEHYRVACTEWNDYGMCQQAELQKSRESDYILTFLLPGPITSVEWRRLHPDPRVQMMVIVGSDMVSDFDESSQTWREYCQQGVLYGRDIYREWYPSIVDGTRLDFSNPIYFRDELTLVRVSPLGGSGFSVTDSLGAVFDPGLSGEIEWYAACDCEENCIAVYGDAESSEFICLCADDDNEDIEKMKERIKQELLSELPPLIKSQLKAEWTPELKEQLTQDLPDSETFKGKVIELVKTAITADETFKTALKDTVRTALLADTEFNAAIANATKERFTSDQVYQKEWIDIIAAAIKAKADGDANGYPMDVGGVEVRVKQEDNTPKSLSFASTASLTSSAIEDALSVKYGGVWSTSGYLAANGKTTANITRVS